ncbi:hypothetical protein BDZ45DRAFT_748644 [Acephala macrosclerotiorum]|nr:hypothetical protein BDZ45DRAFT_748644 [Acephala macrosclerotiorum]
MNVALDNDTETPRHIQPGAILYQCVFQRSGQACRFETQRRSDWVRHGESDEHFPQKRYLCILCINSHHDEHGNPVCAYCLTSISALGNNKQHYLQCPQARESKHTFNGSRDDHFKGHLKRHHSLPGIGAEQSTWTFSVQNDWPSECGFCGDLFLSWQERINHIAGHFREGKDVSAWRLPFRKAKPPRDYGPGIDHYKGFDDGSDNDDDDDGNDHFGGGGSRPTAGMFFGSSGASGPSQTSSSDFDLQGWSSFYNGNALASGSESYDSELKVQEYLKHQSMNDQLSDESENSQMDDSCLFDTGSEASNASNSREEGEGSGKAVHNIYWQFRRGCRRERRDPFTLMVLERPESILQAIERRVKPMHEHCGRDQGHLEHGPSYESHGDEDHLEATFCSDRYEDWHTHALFHLKSRFELAKTGECTCQHGFYQRVKPFETSGDKVFWRTESWQDHSSNDKLPPRLEHLLNPRLPPYPNIDLVDQLCQHPPDEDIEGWKEEGFDSGWKCCMCLKDIRGDYPRKPPTESQDYRWWECFKCWAVIHVEDYPRTLLIEPHDHRQSACSICSHDSRTQYGDMRNGRDPGVGYMSVIPQTTHFWLITMDREGRNFQMHQLCEARLLLQTVFPRVFPRVFPFGESVILGLFVIQHGRGWFFTRPDNYI